MPQLLSFFFSIVCLVCFFICEFQTCELGKRLVLTNSSGSISDGAENYPAARHCEWLIQGFYFFLIFFRGIYILWFLAPPGKYVSIEISSWNLECLYDFLYIYDGPGKNAEKLATITGKSPVNISKVLHSKGNFVRCSHMYLFIKSSQLF